jgi:hypothetical protein
VFGETNDDKFKKISFSDSIVKHIIHALAQDIKFKVPEETKSLYFATNYNEQNCAQLSDYACYMCNKSHEEKAVFSTLKSKAK